MAAWVVRAAEASSLDDVVVVVGFEADRVEAVVSGGRARIVRNDSYPEGNFSSLVVGLDAAQAGSAVMLLVADMPEVSTEMLDVAVDYWRQRKPWAAIARYGDGSVGHPFVFSHGALEAVRQLNGAKPLWRFLIEAHADRVGYIDLSAFRRPRDVNTLDDLETLLGETPNA